MFNPYDRFSGRPDGYREAWAACLGDAFLVRNSKREAEDIAVKVSAFDNETAGRWRIFKVYIPDGEIVPEGEDDS